MDVVMTLLNVIVWVESADPSPLPEEPPIDPSRVTPGLLGFLSFAFLVIAVVLLYRSLRKQMNKVDPNLPDGPGDRERQYDAEVTEQAEEAGESGTAPESGTGPENGTAPRPD